MKDTTVSGHLPVTGITPLVTPVTATEIPDDPEAVVPQASPQQAKQAASEQAAKGKAAATAAYEAAYEKAAASGFFDNCIDTWQQGGTLSAEDMAAFDDLASKALPSEIQGLATQGVISPQTAGALIMQQGLCDALPDPKTLDDVETAMINYCGLSDKDKDFAVRQMSEEDWTEEFAETVALADGTSTSGRSRLAEQQEKIASFLYAADPEDAVDGLEDISLQAVDGRDEVNAAFSRLDGLQGLSGGQRERLKACLVLLAAPLGARDDETTATVAQLFEDEDVQEVTHSMGIIGLFAMVQQTNNDVNSAVLLSTSDRYEHETDEFATSAAAMSKLSEVMPSDGTLDLHSVTFEDADGNTVNLLDWCNMKNVGMPTSLSDDDALTLQYINDPDNIPTPEKSTKKYDVFHKGWWSHDKCHLSDGFFSGPWSKRLKTGYFGKDKVAYDVLNMSDDERAAKKADLMENGYNYDADLCQEALSNISGWGQTQKDNCSMTQSDMQRDTDLYQTMTSQDHEMMTAIFGALDTVASSSYVE